MQETCTLCLSDVTEIKDKRIKINH